MRRRAHHHNHLLGLLVAALLAAITMVEVSSATNSTTSEISVPEQKEPKILIVVMCGSTKKYEDQMNAVLRTWGKEYAEHVWFFTNAKINTENIIHVPDEVENKGYQGVMEKFMLHVIPIVYDRFFKTKKYDWLLKVDPDTFVNLARLKALIGKFRPDVPAYMGGVFFADIGVDFTNHGRLFTMFRRDMEKRIKYSNYHVWYPVPWIPFSHGGGGYIISRTLLDLSVHNFPACFANAPFSNPGWEDVKLPHCFYQSCGIRAIDLTPWGWGALSNTASPDETDRILSEFKPEIISGGVTFHKIFADQQLQMQERIDRVQRVGGAALEFNVTSYNREKFLSYKPGYYASVWNCSVASPDNTKTYSAHCEQTVLAQPESTLVVRESSREWMRWRKSLTSQIWNSLHKLRGRDIILFGVTEEQTNARAMLRFLQSLAGVRTTAAVLVFARPDLLTELESAFTSWAKTQNGNGDGDGNGNGAGGKLDIVYLPWLPHHMPEHLASLKYQSITALLNLWLDFLLHVKIEFGRIMHVTTADVTFQLDPFTSIPTRGGLTLFVTGQLDLLSLDDQLSESVLRSRFGMCDHDMDSAYGRDRPLPFWGPALPSIQVVMASNAAYLNMLKLVVTGMEKEMKSDRKCTPKQLLSRFVWLQELGGTYPLTVIDWLEGPVAFARKENLGQLTNLRNEKYTVLVHDNDLRESEY